MRRCLLHVSLNSPINILSYLMYTGPQKFTEIAVIVY